MEDILKRAKIKRAELMMVIGTLVDYYSERAKVYSKRSNRIKFFALTFALIGLGMLGTFVVKCDGSLKWRVFGVVSVALCFVGAVVIAFFEKRHERANDCLDRIGELLEFADYLRRDPISEENARERKQWYTTRLGILRCEYLDSQRILGGGMEFEELTTPPDFRSDKLLETISKLEANLKICDEAGLSNDITEGVRRVAQGLAD
jgi:hypothetical protein